VRLAVPLFGLAGQVDRRSALIFNDSRDIRRRIGGRSAVVEDWAAYGAARDRGKPDPGQRAGSKSAAR
jgi:hypothetical protein